MDAKQLNTVQAAIRAKFPTPEYLLHWHVDNTPRGVYDFIHKYYPVEFPFWAPNLERTRFYKEQLYDFLKKKYILAKNMGGTKGLEFEIFFSQNVKL